MIMLLAALSLFSHSNKRNLNCFIVCPFHLKTAWLTFSTYFLSSPDGAFNCKYAPYLCSVPIFILFDHLAITRTRTPVHTCIT